MDRLEAEQILRKVQYWHYSFDLPWGSVKATKPGHDTRHWQRRRHFFQPLLTRYGGSLTGKKLLDLGCCQGSWSFTAIEHGATSCLGIDSSPSFILEARALTVVFGINHCEFRCAHLERDPWWNDYDPFDITLFLGLFYHLTDPVSVLRHAMDLTKETIIIDTEVVPRDEPIICLVARDLQEPTTRDSTISSQIRAVPSPMALQMLLTDGGFHHVEFLLPDVRMPSEYLSGHRVSLVAHR